MAKIAKRYPQTLIYSIMKNIVQKYLGKINKKNLFGSLKNTQGLIILANILVLTAIIFVLVRSHGGSDKIYSAKSPEIQETAQMLAKNCANQDQELCYEDAFKSLINDYNFSFAEQTLFALQDVDPMTKSCHILSHFISRHAVRKNPGDWLTLMDQVDVNACGSGFLHGVLESHLGDDPDTEFNAALSEEMCNRGTEDYRKRMCTHFMGHFFIINTNDDVAKAVPFCDGVSEGLKFDCLDGLFMEHNQKIALTDHGLAPAPTYTPEYAKSLEDVCKKYSGIQAGACHTELAEVYAKTFGYDAQAIYSNCYKTPNKELAQNCYFKGQTVLSTYPMDLTAKQLTDICKFYKDEAGAKSCLSNVISSLMYYSPKFTARGLLLCESIPAHNDWCVTELGNKLASIVPSPAERLAFCESAKNEKSRNLCAKV